MLCQALPEELAGLRLTGGTGLKLSAVLSSMLHRIFQAIACWLLGDLAAAAVLLMLQSGTLQLYRVTGLIFGSLQTVSVSLHTRTGDRAGPLVTPLPSATILPVCLQSSASGRAVLTCDEAHRPCPGGRSVLCFPTGQPPHPWGAAMGLGLPHPHLRLVQTLV